MSKYDLTIKKLAFSLLMFPLRSNTLKALIQVLCAAFYGVKARFTTYKADCDMALGFNSQVVYIEAALNYYLAEYLCSHHCCRQCLQWQNLSSFKPGLSKNRLSPLFLSKQGHIGAFRPFVVTVPADLQGNVNINQSH